MKHKYLLVGLLVAAAWLTPVTTADAQLRQFGRVINRPAPAAPQPVGPRVVQPSAGIFNPRSGGVGTPLPALNQNPLGVNPGLPAGPVGGFPPGFGGGFGPFGAAGFNNGLSPFGGFNPYATPFANPYATPFAPGFGTPFANPYVNQFGNPFFNPYAAQPFLGVGFSPAATAQLQNLFLTAQLAQLYGLPLGRNTNNNTAPVVGVGNPGFAAQP